MPSLKRPVLAVCMLAVACGAGFSIATAQPKAGSDTYTDARSRASDADVRVARRAYRGACERHNSVGYCECMTGGMAQELAPHELAVATAAFSHTRVDASREERAHVESVRAEYDHGCASFR